MVKYFCKLGYLHTNKGLMIKCNRNSILYHPEHNFQAHKCNIQAS